MKMYKFGMDCGRMGRLNGLFFAEEDEIALLKEIECIHFGEVLGKHSNIVCPDVMACITEIECSDEVVKMIYEAVGNVGTNPLNYIGEEDETV